MKFALVSEILPPCWSGQAMALYRLLNHLPADSYCLISQDRNPASSITESFSAELPAKHHYLDPGFVVTRGYRFGLSNLRQAINIPLGIVNRSKQIAQILRSEKCTAVVACTGDMLDLPAAYLAGRSVGIKFYAYVFDYYSYREHSEYLSRFLARHIEPRVLKGAARVIVANEFMGADLLRRFDVQTLVINNPCDLAQYETALPESPPTDEFNIVYTGDVYHAHYDAFVNLISAINLLGRSTVKLHLYTTRTKEEMDRAGITGPVVIHPHRALSEMPKIQRLADLLFLPLAFDSPYPEVIRTSAPGKMGEYLAARRPVLVHAPDDSFAASYFREHGCGLVVSENSPIKLAEVITKLIEDESLRQDMSQRAWRRAQIDFAVETARSRFSTLLGLEHPNSDDLLALK